MKTIFPNFFFYYVLNGIFNEHFSATSGLTTRVISPIFGVPGILQLFLSAKCVSETNAISMYLSLKNISRSHNLYRGFLAIYDNTILVIRSAITFCLAFDVIF